MATQWLIGGRTSDGSTSIGVRPLTGFGSTFVTTGLRAQMQVPISEAGNLLRLRVYLSRAPGTGNSVTYVINKNGSNTSLSLTISDSATSGEVVSTVAVSAGDLLTVEDSCSTALTAFSGVFLTEFDPTTANRFSYPAALDGSSAPGTIGAASVPYYSPLLFGGVSPSTTNAIGTTQSISPLIGTLRTLYVHLQTAPGATKSWDFVVVRNGSEEATSVLNIAGTSTSGSVTGLSIGVSAGDVLVFKVKTATNTPASTRVGFAITLEPTTAGQFAVGGEFSGNPSTSVATFFSDGQSAQGNNRTTEANDSSSMSRWPSPKAALKYSAFYVTLNTAPSSGKSWTFVSRKAGSDGSLTFSISDTATSNSDLTHSDSPSLDELMGWKVTPIGAPTNMGGLMWAIAVETVADDSETQGLITATAAMPAMAVSLDAPAALMAATARSYDLDISSVDAAMAVLQASAQLGGLLLDGELGMAKMAAAAREPAAAADLQALMDAMAANAAMPDLTAVVYAIWADIRREIDPADWAGTPILVHLEVHGEGPDPHALDPDALFRAHLFNETTNAIVENSELSGSAITKTRLRSAAFSFAAGANVYHVEFAVDYTMFDAVLIVDVG